MADPLVVEAFALLESEIIAQWEACPTRDTEGRELLWAYYKTARKFKSIFDGAIQSGKIADLRESQSITDKAVNIFKGKRHA